jgi:hypothetical protein
LFRTRTRLPRVLPSWAPEELDGRSHDQLYEVKPIVFFGLCK